MVQLANDPCDDLAALPWVATAGVTVTAAGHTGNGFQVPSGSSNELHYVLPAGAQTAMLSVGAWVKFATLAPGHPVLSFRSDDGATIHVALFLVSGQLQVRRGSTGLIGGAFGAIAVGTWYRIEMQCSLHDTTGTVNLLVDGATVGTFTGDTRNAGTKVVFDQVRFSSTGSISPWQLDDIYIRNDLTVGIDPPPVEPEPVPVVAPVSPWSARVTLDVQLGVGTRGGALGRWDVSRWDRAGWSGLEPAWDSVRCDVAAVSIVAGRAGPLEPFGPSTLELTVTNETGYWSWRPDIDPDQLPMRPGRPIRIMATDHYGPHGTVCLWRGFIERVDDTFDAVGVLTATVTALDGLAQWALTNPVPVESPVGTGSSVQARLYMLAAIVGWPADWTRFDQSTNTLTGTTLTGTALDLAVAAVAAEGGAFYVDRDGTAVFRLRDWLSTDPAATEVQYELGTEDRPGWLCPVSYELIGPDLADVANDVVLGRDGAPLLEVVDEHSIDLYQRRTYSDLVVQADRDEQVSLLARRRLGLTSRPRPKVTAAVLDPEADPACWDLILTAVYGMRLGVHYRHPTAGWGWDLESHVHAVTHVIDAPPGRWTTTLGLFDASAFPVGTAWDRARWDTDRWSADATV